MTMEVPDEMNDDGDEGDEAKGNEDQVGWKRKERREHLGGKEGKGMEGRCGKGG